MEQALGILDRALQGDSGALSFLERTSSIYALDATGQGPPKTYGCWDFINQALSEVERFEALNPSRSGSDVSRPDLSYHVRLLSTMSRKAARRSPDSDRRLISICLTNAAKYHASPEEAQALVDGNCVTRERVMGRMAVLVLDFSYHRTAEAEPSRPVSAFSDLVAMEGLCGAVAANAVSSGPESIHDLCSDWIIPSVQHLPPFSVAAIVYNLGNEAMGKAAPAGTRDMMHGLTRIIMSVVLCPMLSDALSDSEARREECDDSDGDDHDERNSSSSFVTAKKLVTIAMRALERWCAATDLTIAQLQKYCSNTKVNIAGIISDSLYSDSDSIIDASAELLDTILVRKKQQDDRVLASSDLSYNNNNSPPSNLVSTMVAMAEEAKNEEEFLSELASAIGLQRFRFVGRETVGDTGVCRCLARIAASITLSLQSKLRSNQLDQRSSIVNSGMIDLLLKAASHSSYYVCGIALEALPSIAISVDEISNRLLPVLQNKAIFPAHITHDRNDASDIMEEDDTSQYYQTDLSDFCNFRDNLLHEALLACYTNNRVHYLESCVSAVEQICCHAHDDPPPSSSYQLEAALFCLVTVSVDTVKRALLVNRSRAAQAAAARASSLRRGPEKHHDRSSHDNTIAENAAQHDSVLARCAVALAKDATRATENPLVLAQMCRFIAHYASWFARSPTTGVLDSGAELALMSFKLSGTSFRDAPNSVRLMKEMTVSPFAEAASALRNILSRSPSHFNTPQALAALAGAWEVSYSPEKCNILIGIKDREALCSGICRVLISLPSSQWIASLTALARPTIDSLELVAAKVDALLPPSNNGRYGIVSDEGGGLLMLALVRGSEEISLLSTMTRVFNDVIHTGGNDTNRMRRGAVNHHSENPALAIFRRAWPCLSLVAQKCGMFEVITCALGDFLKSCITIRQVGSNVPVLRELCDMAATIFSALKQAGEEAPLAPMLEFVLEVVDHYGTDAECDIWNSRESSSPISTDAAQMKHLIEGLLTISDDAMTAALGEQVWYKTKKREQVVGQQPFEVSPPMRTIQMEKKNKNPESLSGMFAVLKMCIERCPLLLIMTLNSCGSATHGNNPQREEDGLFWKSVDIATATVGEKEVDVARSAMLYLKAVIDLKGSNITQLDSTEDQNGDENRWQVIGPAVNTVVEKYRRELTYRLVSGTCGTFPRGALNSLAPLLQALLRRTPQTEARTLVTSALLHDQFLEDNMRNVTSQFLGRCCVAGPGALADDIPPARMVEFVSDLWDLHQTDEPGVVAGGDAVNFFKLKYSLR